MCARAGGPRDSRGFHESPGLGSIRLPGPSPLDLSLVQAALISLPALGPALCPWLAVRLLMFQKFCVSTLFCRVEKVMHLLLRSLGELRCVPCGEHFMVLGECSGHSRKCGSLGGKARDVHLKHYLTGQESKETGLPTPSVGYIHCSCNLISLAETISVPSAHSLECHKAGAHSQLQLDVCCCGTLHALVNSRTLWGADAVSLGRCCGVAH